MPVIPNSRSADNQKLWPVIGTGVSALSVMIFLLLRWKIVAVND
jgi:hypothetical protein